MSYVSQKQGPNLAGIAAAVLINGAVVAAAFMTSMAITPKIIEDRIKAFHVPIKQPPPPDVIKKPIDKVIIKKTNPLFVDKPIIDTPIKSMERMTTTSTVVDIPLYTQPTGEEVSLNTGVKQVIERVLPPSIFKTASRDPKFARNFQPDYPLGLLQREIEGKVTIKVLIGADGRVRQANVASATHAEFGTATQRKALRDWRFTPATRDGKSVEDWQTLTVSFNINE